MSDFSLGGVTFRIKVSGGKSAANTKKIVDELERLENVADRLAKSSSKVASANKKVESSSRGAAKAAAKETTNLGITDQAIRGQIKLLARIARDKQRATAKAIADSKREVDGRLRDIKRQEAAETRFYRLLRANQAKLENEKRKAVAQATRSAAAAGGFSRSARLATHSAADAGKSSYDESAPIETQLKQARTVARQKLLIARKLSDETSQLAAKSSAAQRQADKAVTVQAKQSAAIRAAALANEAKTRSGAAKRAAAESRKAAAAAKRLEIRMARLAMRNREVGDSFDGMASAVQLFVSYLGARQLSRFIKNVTLLSGRVENLDTVMRNTGATANYSSGQLSFYEAQIRQLGITTQATRTVMTRFAQNGLEVAGAIDIARIAQDAAVVAGINSSQATDKMAVAIQRLDTRMLRNLGILVNLRQEYQSFGLQTGRVETSLTAAEKQQIVYNAVIREGAALAGNYEAALGDVYKRYTSLDRKIEEASRTIGDQFLPAFGAAVDTADYFLGLQAKGYEANNIWLFRRICG